MSAITPSGPTPAAPPPPRAPRRESTQQSRVRRDQLAGVAIAGAMLLMIFGLQPFLQAQRSVLVKDNGDTLRQLSIEFPRLTLTGLRGIITPVLWSRAEDQKNERKWVELNTTYAMIAKLEPYFVTVYVFNAWNQAYNLSAQWHAIDDKFRWVLDGLQHLYEGEQLNPNAPDLLLEEAQMYFLKIGNSYERITYRRMWRDHIADQYKFDNNSKDMATDTHAQVRQFILRPEFHAELQEDPEHPTMKGFGIRIKGIEDLDGRSPEKANKEMSFRYGVSPFYFAYAEYDRLIKTGGRPSTLVPKTIDAFRAMALRMWCRDDTYHLGELLRMLFLPAEPLSQDRAQALVFEAADCARNTPVVEPQAQNLFMQNIAQWPANEAVHRKHMNELHALVPLNAGEYDLLRGLLAYRLANDTLTPEAQQRLSKAITEYDQGIARFNLYIDTTWPDKNHPDRADPEALVAAMRTRVAGIQAVMTREPGKPLDLSFLKPDIVER